MRNTILTIVFGIVAWAVALVFLIATNSSANSIWICLVGIALGLLGLRYSIRRGKREGWK
jgi:hypothetical protein